MFDQTGADGSVPSWAGFFSPGEYQRFLSLIREYFREENVDISTRDATVSVVGPVQVYGLQNLAQICHSGSRAEWVDIIGRHFSGLRQAEEEAEVVEDSIKDFATAADLLAVRLYPKDSLSVFDPGKLIFREDLEGTVTALVFDLPTTIQTVPKEMLTAWDVTEGCLFERALANVKAHSAPDISRQHVVEDVEIFTILGDSFLTSTHALLLDTHPGCVGPHGALVSVPHRHAVLCYPIVDMNLVTALNSMIPVTESMFEEGPGSVSPHVYWYHHGQFINLPYELGDHSLDFDPPEEFLVLLNTLAERTA